MVKGRRILVAMADKNLAKELTDVFNGNLEIVEDGAEAVKKFNEEGYNIVVMDYLVKGNSLKSTIKIKAFSNDVKVVGYRWESEFDLMLNYNRKNYNRKSQKALVAEMCRDLGMDGVYAEQILERFDDLDRTPQKGKNANNTNTYNKLSQ